MFNQFGGVDVGHDDRRLERGIDLFHRRNRPLRANADDDAVGLHEVLDGEAFAEEFGVADDVTFDAGLAVTLDGFGDFVAGLDGHGALIDDDLVIGHGRGDFTGDPFDEARIHRTVRQRRRRHGDENDV